MPANSISGDVTILLQRCGGGDIEARADLVNLMYPELKRIARNRMHSERTDHTLQATALVNEFFLQMARREDLVWRNRAHFLAAASEAMKRLLIDYARSRSAEKRGGGQILIRLDMVSADLGESGIELLDLNHLLTRLHAEEPRMAQVIEMRCFGGLTNREIAECIGIDERTVKRDWQVGRAWLISQLKRGAADG
jgi:RNA polymerase sigma factor (TIGR02999 family)